MPCCAARCAGVLGLSIHGQDAGVRLLIATQVTTLPPLTPVMAFVDLQSGMTGKVSMFRMNLSHRAGAPR